MVLSCIPDAWKVVVTSTICPHANPIEIPPQKNLIISPKKSDNFTFTVNGAFPNKFQGHKERF